MKQMIILVIVCILSLAGCTKMVETDPTEQAAAEPEVARPRPGDMVLIPAGEFTMGNSKRDLDAPERRVDLPAYEIDVFEVTFGQWMTFTTDSGHEPEGNWRQFYSIGKEDFPVANITHDDAKSYAKWAGKRLPTEAEWEKAARGPDGNPYPWGEKWDPTKSNCNEIGFRNTVRVGEMRTDKSVYGVHDMMGNVQEWTSDVLKAYPRSPAANDDVFKRGYIAVRGGSYAMKGDSMFLWTRSGYFPKSQYGLGFRCVRDVEQPAQAFKERLGAWAVAIFDLQNRLTVH
jgi:formylglycine-generating enzyme required for sulfatase activity